jgi:hypothetical protein
VAQRLQEARQRGGEPADFGFLADYGQGDCINTAVNIESQCGGGLALTAKIENKTPAGIVPVD